MNVVEKEEKKTAQSNEKKVHRKNWSYKNSLFMMILEISKKLLFRGKKKTKQTNKCEIESFGL